MDIEKPKPLGIKSYGTIGHLPNSRMGPADHAISIGQANICTKKLRNKYDYLYVEEKLDGSCTAVTKLNGQILALGRAGYLADTSPFEQHKMFASWVKENESRFVLLNEGERLVGEWLAQAHGTRYNLFHEPWVVFDLMQGHYRIPRKIFRERVSRNFIIPFCLHEGFCSYSVEQMLENIQISRHGAIDPVEGAVWRVENKGAFDFLAKYVRPDKKDGLYLPEISGKEAVWNWRLPQPEGR